MEVTRTFDIIDLNVEKYPQEVMYGGGQRGAEWVTLSTDKVRQYVDYVSVALLALGFKRDDKIALISGNRIEWNLADMGMSQIGVISVPIYPTISSTEYTYILKHAEVKALFIGNKSIYNRILPIATELGVLDKIYSFEKIDEVHHFDEIIEIGKANYDKYYYQVQGLKKSITPDDVFTIIYTSGTTGNPKGVMLSHRNLVSNAIATAPLHHIHYGQRAASFLPLCHVFERMMNYNYQYNGISVYYIDNLSYFSDALKYIKPHIFNVVPRLVEKVFDNIMSKGRTLTGIKKFFFNRSLVIGNRYKLQGNSPIYKLKLALYRKLVFNKWKEALGGELKLMICGGAAMQPRLERIFWAANIPINVGYGLTETSPVIAVNPHDVKNMCFGTVGPILKEVTTVKLADDGEILCKGINVMKGYYKAPELTARAIDEDGWFHTGDIGVFVDEKYLKITDRKKEIFKLSAGKYVAPQPIENRLKESSFIEQVLIIGENEKYVSALISPNFQYLHEWCHKNKIQYRDNAELIEKPEVLECISKEIKEVNKTLSDYENIKKFKLVIEEWTPQTGELSPTLKLKRNYLLNRYKDIIDEIYCDKDKDETVIQKIKESIGGVLKNLPKN